MTKKPSLVTSAIQDYMSRGWNKVQATSLAWAEFFSQKDAEYEARAGRNGWSMGGGSRIDCYCKTCKDGGHLLPDTVIMWLGMHKDHDTKTMRLR